MRSVKSKGNKSTEQKLIEIFKKNKLKGWRRNYPLYGKPDIVFPRLRVVVFADGCFWHGHNCRNTKPSDNAEYWKKKIERNKKRDRLVTKTLRSKGWKVVRLWECEINKNKFLRKINSIKEAKKNI
ncbi:DNA mismatch endonuclease Vsr [Melioribacter roseus P3M-2]|uniref:DNA mismatch endonuclease Vsr n=2 Tax=Melioribacteraceae TaxID=1334117 RepID=I7A2L8_MELRP|nr:DNA mismatch endonuclease Vsr [Melioribacter roseus P3M-2]